MIPGMINSNAHKNVKSAWSNINTKAGENLLNPSNKFSMLKGSERTSFKNTATSPSINGPEMIKLITEPTYGITPGIPPTME